MSEKSAAWELGYAAGRDWAKRMLHVFAWGISWNIVIGPVAPGEAVRDEARGFHEGWLDEETAAIQARNQPAAEEGAET